MIRIKLLLAFGASIMLPATLAAQQGATMPTATQRVGGATTSAAKRMPPKKGVEAAEKEQLLEAVRATARQAAAAHRAVKK